MPFPFMLKWELQQMKERKIIIHNNVYNKMGIVASYLNTFVLFYTEFYYARGHIV